MQPNCYWRDKWEGERRVNQDKRRVFSSNTSKLLMTGTQQGLYFQILLWQLLVTRFQLALIDAIQQALDCLLAEQFYTDLRSILLMLILIKCTNPEHRYAKACELKKKIEFFHRICAADCWGGNQVVSMSCEVHCNLLEDYVIASS